MAERHDQILAKYRSKLVKDKFKIEGKSPFVDYRPDIFASKNGVKLFVEVEIESTLHTDHTLHQLNIMYEYIVQNKDARGVLLVPKTVANEAKFLIDLQFGNKLIKVVAD